MQNKENTVSTKGQSLQKQGNCKEKNQAFAALHISICVHTHEPYQRKLTSECPKVLLPAVVL